MPARARVPAERHHLSGMSGDLDGKTTLSVNNDLNFSLFLSQSCRMTAEDFLTLRAPRIS